jgi:hypothetical protein
MDYSKKTSQLKINMINKRQLKEAILTQEFIQRT